MAAHKIGVCISVGTGFGGGEADEEGECAGLHLGLKLAESGLAGHGARAGHRAEGMRLDILPA